MITTRNRCAELRQTCQRITSMNPAPHEVLICADGCTDGTVALIREEFPQFVLLENSVPQGSVASRDRLLRAATGEIVVSLDDDSTPVDDDFFSRVCDVFLAHPEAAVITFPELRSGGSYADSTATNTSPGHYVSAYANCAAAMRRDFYLRQPGFPPFFVHMYEEPDYALQCYAAGSAVWFEPSLVVYHRQSEVGRAPLQRQHQNARNQMWSVWLRCPWPMIPVVSALRAFSQFRYALSCGFLQAMQEPVWWFQALAGIAKCIRARRAIEWKCYYAWMWLTRRHRRTLRDLSFNNLHSQQRGGAGVDATNL
jgi:GT2 family glycosyltransferase